MHVYQNRNNIESETKIYEGIVALVMVLFVTIRQYSPGIKWNDSFEIWIFVKSVSFQQFRFTHAFTVYAKGKHT